MARKSSRVQLLWKLSCRQCSSTFQRTLGFKTAACRDSLGFCPHGRAMRFGSVHREHRARSTAPSRTDWCDYGTSVVSKGQTAEVHFQEGVAVAIKSRPAPDDASARPLQRALLGILPYYFALPGLWFCRRKSTKRKTLKSSPIGCFCEFSRRAENLVAAIGSGEQTSCMVYNSRKSNCALFEFTSPSKTCPEINRWRHKFIASDDGF